MAEFAGKQLRLKLHKAKSRIYKCDEGVTFLGIRVFPDGRRLERENVARFRRKLKRMVAEYGEGVAGLRDIKPRIAGWIGHAANADTYELRRQIFSGAVFIKGSVRDATD